MGAPLAYLLTWTCYGSWLHGDERGSVDKEHNIRGAPYLAPNARRRRFAGDQMLDCRVELDARSRGVVEQAIRDHCVVRGWDLLALAVRTTHIHSVVVCPPDVPPERVLTEFKAWSTRRLRAAGGAAPGTKLWTHHGSTRWINDRRSLNAAIAYVLEGQSTPR